MLAYEFAKEGMQPTSPDEDMPPLVQPNSTGAGKVPVLLGRDRAQQLKERGLPWNEMATIYRDNWMGETAFQQLQQTRLPVDWLNQRSSSRNFDLSTQSIKLMTMHASKGLEFPVYPWG